MKEYTMKEWTTRKEYDALHNYCPKCGSTSCCTTLVGYMFRVAYPMSYKDENRCTCTVCGDVHSVDDRTEFNNFGLSTPLKMYHSDPTLMKYETYQDHCDVVQEDGRVAYFQWINSQGNDDWVFKCYKD